MTETAVLVTTDPTAALENGHQQTPTLVTPAPGSVWSSSLNIGTTTGTAADGGVVAALGTQVTNLAAAAVGPFVYCLDSAADPSIAHYLQLTPDFAFVNSTLATATATGTPSTTVQFAIGGNPVAWISQTAIGSTEIQDGEWAAQLFASVNQPVSTTNLMLSVYTRALNGTETHQFDITGPRVTASTPTESSQDFLGAQYPCNTTDHLVVKIFAVLSGTGVSTTATLDFQGSGALVSHLHTPLAASLYGSLPVATESTNGLMLATDKTKLDGIAAGATANTLAIGTTTGTAADGGVVAALTAAAAAVQPVIRKDTAITIPSASTTSGTAYTVPSGKIFDLEKILLVLDTPITDAGSCVVSIGVAAGGQEYILNVTLTSASTAGVQAGALLLSLGASMLASQGFEALLSAAAVITWQCVTTGSVSAGAVRVIVKGMLI